MGYIPGRSRFIAPLKHKGWLLIDTHCQAEEVDAELREYTMEEPMVSEDGGETYSYPLSSWVFHYKLRIMEWIVLLGFELEIYQPYELAGMYWVVQHYISSHILHIDRIRNHLLHQATKQVPEEWTAQQQDTLAYLTYLSIEAKAQHDLVAALLNVCRQCTYMPHVTITSGSD